MPNLQSHNHRTLSLMDESKLYKVVCNYVFLLQNTKLCYPITRRDIYIKQFCQDKLESNMYSSY